MPEILPPLHQSDVEMAACPRSYVAIRIEGKRTTESVSSERGTDVHHVMAEYVRQCAANKVASDWPLFNRLAAASGPMAGKILDGLRDRYEVDWKRVYGTEVKLMLDEEFNPSDFDPTNGEVVEGIPGVEYSGKPAAHAGTLDVLLLNGDVTSAKVEDYKSHPAPFEADTYQSTLYPFMVLKHFPSLLRVKFELHFVRYKGSFRSVTWTREDMPAMQAEISRARERQRLTHENPDAALAIPCKQCAYCPLAKDFSCPIAEFNEHTILTLEERLRWREWMRRMNEYNNPILKTHAAVNGPITYEDGNAKRYTYGMMDVPETRYPLDRTALKLLDDWRNATGEDLLDGTLNISSTKLKQRLATKKRTALKDQFEDSVIETGTKPRYAVRVADEGIVPDYNPYEQED